MPDICMCHGKKIDGSICPMKDKCYRYYAKPDMLQSYFAEAPFIGASCTHLWERDKKKVK